MILARAAETIEMRTLYMKKTLALLLALVLLCGCGAAKTPLEQATAYLKKATPEPTLGSLTGDWTVFGLARSGSKVSQKYYDIYYKNVEAAVAEKGGRLSETKYTEYSRLVLALTAIGRDPRDVGGYDLLVPLADQERATTQGVNGAVFALLALDSAQYEIPDDPDAAVQATREGYVAEILSRQNEDGGWSLAGGPSDVDLTAMALQALAKYCEDAVAAAAVERGLAWLEWEQEPDGTFISWDTVSSESVCQVLVALTELGIPLDDERFVKNGATLEDVLLRFQLEDGSFAHTQGSGSDITATTQALYALAAAQRQRDGKTTLYDMTDIAQ